MYIYIYTYIYIYMCVQIYIYIYIYSRFCLKHIGLHRAQLLASYGCVTCCRPVDRVTRAIVFVGRADRSRCLRALQQPDQRRSLACPPSQAWCR